MNIFSPDPVKSFDLLSQKRIEYVSSLRPESHVHVLGASGTGTGAIVCLLKQLGFRVSGSDKAFYPPMGDFIKKFADVLYNGFSVNNLKDKPDLVVIGNALSRGNEELEEVLSQGIPFCSMPELLSALLIGNREENPTSVVISGTHGKTTTTALHAHVLSVLNKNPAYFFGGVPTGNILDLPIRPHSQEGDISKRISVIEGDEYDSAFFAKYSKFHCYRPDILVITNIEFDHGDIFENLESIKAEFRELIKKVPKTGCVVVCYDAEVARDLAIETLSQIAEDQRPNLITYGFSEFSDVRIVSKNVIKKNDSMIQEINFSVKNKNLLINTALTGDHNALNIGALIGVFSFLKIDLSLISEAILSYSHVMRRQQIHVNGEKVVLIEDFAHHPTEVYYTLSGIKQAFPNRRLISVFEPRSNTSRRAFFKDEYARALGVSDVIVIKEVDSKNPIYSGVNKDTELLNVSDLVNEFKSEFKKDKLAYSSHDIDDLYNYVRSNYQPGDVVVVMSNGDFGGIIKKFIELFLGSL